MLVKNLERGSREGRLTQLGFGSGHDSVADWDYQLTFDHGLGDSWVVEGEEF